MKDALQHAITYAPPAERDQKSLRAMARQSFSETFAHLYEPGPFREFLDRTYGANGAMDRDLNDLTIQWLVAFYESEPVGYAKLTPLRAPAPSALAGAAELQQIYVVSEWHGRGTGGPSGSIAGTGSLRRAAVPSLSAIASTTTGCGG